MTPEAQEFTHISHKKARTPKNRKSKERPRERTVAERVEARRGALVESGYVRECRELLREALLPSKKPGAASSCPPPVCLVCLGLGSVADSRKSQEQFVLLQGLVEELGDTLVDKSTIYDPVFTEGDYAYLLEEGLEALKAEHDLSFDRVTLLYMPHCPRPLINEVLKRNWSPEKLRRLVILGNRLDMYDDPTHSSATNARSRSPYISKSASLFNIIALPPTKDHLEAFNDLALQWAPIERIEQKPSSYWDVSESTREAGADEGSASVDNRVDEKKRELDRIQQELVKALSGVSLE